MLLLEESVCFEIIDKLILLELVQIRKVVACCRLFFFCLVLDLTHWVPLPCMDALKIESNVV